MLRDEEPLCDLVRAEVLVEEEQHFDLSGGEYAGDRFWDSVRPASVSNAVEESARDTSRECCIASRYPTKESRDLLGGLRLEEVARRPRADCREQVLLRVRCGEHDDLTARRVLSDLWQCGEAVHSGHRQVVQDEIGLKRLCLPDRLPAVCGRAYYIESLLREQR